MTDYLRNFMEGLFGTPPLGKPQEDPRVTAYRQQLQLGRMMDYVDPNQRMTDSPTWNTETQQAIQALRNRSAINNEPKMDTTTLMQLLNPQGVNPNADKWMLNSPDMQMYNYLHPTNTGGA